MQALRSLGLARGAVGLGLVLATGVFGVMAYEGKPGGAVGGILLLVLLISFVQTGLTRAERLGFSLAAVALGLLAIAVGGLAGV